MLSKHIYRNGFKALSRRISTGEAAITQPLHFLDGKRVNATNPDASHDFKLVEPATGVLKHNFPVNEKRGKDAKLLSCLLQLRMVKKKVHVLQINILYKEIRHRLDRQLFRLLCRLTYRHKSHCVNVIPFAFSLYFISICIMRFAGKELGVMRGSSVLDVDKAVNSAKEAQKHWGELTGLQRGKIMSQAGRIIKVRVRPFCLGRICQIPPVIALWVKFTT